MRKSLQVVIMLVAVQVLLLAVYLGVQSNRNDSSISVDRLSRPAPELTLRSNDGSVLHLSDLRGSTIVLHFWATWCPPCREELPSLFGFAATGAAEVLAVSVDPEWRVVGSFVEAGSLEYVYLASADAVSDAFGVDELPQTFVIDSTGTLRLHFRSSRDWNSPTLRAMIAKLADESSAPASQRRDTTVPDHRGVGTPFPPLSNISPRLGRALGDSGGLTGATS